jgi:hypothetical protein
VNSNYAAIDAANGYPSSILYPGAGWTLHAGAKFRF